MTNLFTDKDFQEKVLKSELPVIVDFYAEWCGPCKIMSPTIDKLSEHYNEKILIGKMNIDANSITVEKYGIQSVPTLILFKGGEEIDRLVGYKSEEELKKHIDSLL